jgi:hypothetical protein
MTTEVYKVVWETVNRKEHNCHDDLNQIQCIIFDPFLETRMLPEKKKASDIGRQLTLSTIVHI